MRRSGLPNSAPRGPHIVVRIGAWFEAQASGWAVLVVPLVLFGMLAGAWLLRG